MRHEPQLLLRENENPPFFEKTGQGSDGLDIKRGGIFPLTQGARVLALEFGMERTDHAMGDSVERFGPIERDNPGRPASLEQDFVARRCHAAERALSAQRPHARLLQPLHRLVGEFRLRRVPADDKHQN